MAETERMSINAVARLQPNNWSSVEITLLDCSAEGFRADCDVRLRVGDLVTLEAAPLAPCKARVETVNCGEIVARFLEPLPCRPELPEASPESRLARLLVRRATIRRAGLKDEERRIRREILSALPMRRLG